MLTRKVYPVVVKVSSLGQLHRRIMHFFKTSQECGAPHRQKSLGSMKPIDVPRSTSRPWGGRRSEALVYHNVDAGRSELRLRPTNDAGLVDASPRGSGVFRGPLMERT